METGWVIFLVVLAFVMGVFAAYKFVKRKSSSLQQDQQDEIIRKAEEARTILLSHFTLVAADFGRFKDPDNVPESLKHMYHQTLNAAHRLDRLLGHNTDFDKVARLGRLSERRNTT